jgi:murein DD-endopeptidase MepM/ murein hydrolase activator NlpD
VAVLASRHDNEETSDARGATAAVTWEDGAATVSSSVSDGALFSTATVSITHIDLLDGLVTADSMELVADAAATTTAVSGGVDVSRIAGLKVHGLDVDPDSLPLAIPGVGVLTALETREVPEEAGMEAEVTGLRLHLTSGWKGIPEDSDIVIGSAAACADQDTAARLLPTTSAAGSSDDSSGDSDGGTSGGSSGGSGADESGGGGGSSGGDGSSGGGGSSGDSFRPGKMHEPARQQPGDLMSFPGAVFPVDGPVWYQDDFGAPRAVGGGHTGNDVFARRGTPLVAVQDGTIAELRYRSLGGNSFHLVNAEGDYFYYAHLMRYAAGIQEGSAVMAGQVLGYVGNSGNAITTPPHLHFEIHPGGGSPVDPYPYLELWRGDSAAAAGDSAGDAASPEASPAAGVPTISLEAEEGRHEQSVLPPAAPVLQRRGAVQMAVLVPAALTFGLAGGLTTAIARRRQVLLVTMDATDLDRAARAG